MELQLARPMNGLVSYLADKVNVVDYGINWVRYATPDPTQFNPVLLAELARQDTPVVTLSEVSRSLEEVYLRIVESDHQVEPDTVEESLATDRVANPVESIV